MISGDSHGALSGAKEALCAGESGVLDFRNFPTTRYQGSKRKLLPWMHKVFSDLNFDSALDLFGGTGCVSYLLKRMGKAVTFNDYLKFNYIIGRAIIENDRTRLDVAALPELTRGSQAGAPGIIHKHFDRFYYTQAENAWLDMALSYTHALDSRGRRKSYKSDLILYALIQSCLIKRPFNLFHRKNLGLREADVPRSFGNKKNWDRPFQETLLHFMEEVNGLVFCGSRPCTAQNSDALLFPKQDYDLVYMDPPYVSRSGNNETSDYRKVYHFLEGMCRYEEWPSLIDQASSTLCLHRVTNDWVDPKKNTAAMSSAFELFRHSIIVVSYKQFGIPCIDTIVRRLKSLNKKVRVLSRPYKYALNSRDRPRPSRECLIIAE